MAAELRHILKNHPTFEVASESKRELLAAAMQVVSFTKGQHITEQGKVGDGVYLLIEGRIEVVQRDEATSQTDVHELNGGDLFGLLSLVPGMPASTTSTALSDVRVARLSRAAYENLFATAPSMARQLQYMVAIRLARELQNRNRALRALLRQQATAS